MRSATVAEIFKEDTRFTVKSAGTHQSATTLLSETVLGWADSIIVMEKHHRNTIRKRFPQVYQTKKIVCLYIEDNYEFMQEELIYSLQEKIEDVYRRGLL